MRVAAPVARMKELISRERAGPHLAGPRPCKAALWRQPRGVNTRPFPMNKDETKLAIMFGARSGSLIGRWFGPILTWFGFAILGAHPVGLIAYAIAGAWWWWRGPRTMPRSSLSRGWKINLYLHAGCGSAGAGAALLLYYGPASLQLGGVAGTLPGILQCALGLGLVAYALWYWLRVHRHIRPVFVDSRPAVAPEAIGQIAQATAAAHSALSALDDAPDTSATAAAPSGARTFHDGSGHRVEVDSTGVVRVAGKFIGHRDAQGRIIDGCGKFVGTLRDDGGMHGPNGDYVGRVFR